MKKRNRGTGSGIYQTLVESTDFVNKNKFIFHLKALFLITSIIFPECLETFPDKMFKLQL